MTIIPVCPGGDAERRGEETKDKGGHAGLPLDAVVDHEEEPGVDGGDVQSAEKDDIPPDNFTPLVRVDQLTAVHAVDVLFVRLHGVQLQFVLLLQLD